MKRSFLRGNRMVLISILLVALVSLCWPQNFQQAARAAGLQAEETVVVEDNGLGEANPPSNILIARTTPEGNSVYVPLKDRKEPAGTPSLPDVKAGKQALSSPANTSLKNFSITNGVNGGISGKVLESDGTTPVEGAFVLALREGGSGPGSSWFDYSDITGSYSIGGLSQGQFTVSVFATGFITEYYHGVTELADATLVDVDGSNITPNINFTLDKLGSISGKVTQADGSTAIPGAIVEAWLQDLPHGTPVTTEEDGTYILEGLEPGSYKVSAQAAGYIIEYYNEKSSLNDATLVIVSSGEAEVEINFTLDQLGAISGQVFQPGGASPLAGASVTAASLDGFDGGNATTDAEGLYEITGLHPGQYKVQAQAEGYSSKYYNGKASFENADPVTVAAGATTPDIDFTLDEPGSISGFVRQSDGQTPISGAKVAALNSEGLEAGYAFSNGTGIYTIINLGAGQYLVMAQASSYAQQYYNGAASIGDADPVTVNAGGNTDNINFSLEQRGSISGLVKTAAGAPVAGALVTAQPQNELDAGYDTSAADGSYKIKNLNPGQYKVSAVASGYVPEYYDGASSLEAANPVTVNAGVDTDKIDFSLDLPGAISGFVYKASDGSPIAGAFVEAFPVETLDGGFAITGTDGSYTISDLKPGHYKVSAEAEGYITEYYNGAAKADNANPVAILSETTTPAINFTLDQPGKIAGHVYKSTDGAPVANAEVNAWSEVALDGGSAITAGDGSYIISGLSAGQYQVRAEAQGLSFEYYQETFDPENAKPVAVIINTTTGGIDFTLEPVGSISGVIRKVDPSSPLAGADVMAQKLDGSYYGFATSAENGSYKIEGLIAGEYRVSADADKYLLEYYNGTYDRDLAAPVVVTAPGDKSSIDIDLDLGGVISGKVFQSNGTAPIPGANVEVTAVDGSYHFASTVTDQNGAYTVDELFSGQYIVGARANGYCEEYYNGVYYSSLSAPITVTAPQTTADINFNLDVGGGISGKIFQADGTTPLAGATVAVYPLSLGDPIGSTVSGTDGSYLLQNILPTGSFRVGASKAGYAFKYYGGYYEAKATPVPVTMPQVTPTINISLGLAGSISGQVKKADGTLMAYALVVASPQDGSVSFADTCSQNGSYTISSLHPGSYRVYAYAFVEDTIQEWYKAGGNVYFYNQADFIPIAASQASTGIDFHLEKGGTISGYVYKTDGAPIKGAQIATSLYYTYGLADISGADGSYKLTGLPPGSHYVYAAATGYQLEYYNNSATSAKATRVNISGTNTVTGINFSLAAGGTISGCIYQPGVSTVSGYTYQAESKIPLDSAQVSFYDKNNKYIASVMTGWNGTYQSIGFAAAGYKVNSHHHAFASRWNNNVYDKTKATAVTVTNPGNAGGVNVDLEVNPTLPASLSITTDTLADGYIGQSYSQTLTVAGGTGPYAWSKTGTLPSGLSLNAKTGAITGTPKGALANVTPFTFTVKVSDKSKLSDEREVLIVVHPPMTIVVGTPVDAEVGLTYKGWIPSVVEGTAPFTWSLVEGKGNLPPGLAQDASTGAISGTPNEAIKSNKKYSFTIKALDSQGKTAIKAIAISVYPALTISTTTLPAGEINIAYKKQTLNATGGTKKYSWSVTELPPGLAQSKNTISGTPTVAGVYNPILQVNDGIGGTVLQIPLTVYPSPAIKTQTLPDGTLNTAYYPESPVTLVLDKGCAPAKTWALVKGYALPAGLKLDSKKGIISGKSTKVGTFNFQVKCTDTLGGVSVPADFTITVK